MKTGLEWIAQKEVYQEYLRRLDVRAVLEHYGAQNMIEQADEIVHSCLLDRVEPHHTNGDAHPSACANMEKKLYVCYALGFGCDMIHLIQKLENAESLTDSMTAIGAFLTGATIEATRLRTEIDKIFASGAAYHLDLPSYSPQVLDAWDHPHPYWEQRGISPAAQKLLRLGYDERSRRVTIPAFANHTLVGWQKRTVCGEYPKYLSSSGFPKSETLYGLDLAKENLGAGLIVVESPLSVARAYSEGIINTVATWGSKTSQAQINQLADFDPVAIWFDRDAAGLAGEKKLVEGLYHRTTVRVVSPERGKDLGDLSRREIERKLLTSVSAHLKLGEYDLRRKFYGQPAR